MVTTYNKQDLIEGTCICCSMPSDKIVPESKWCINCVEELKFYERTMNGINQITL